MDYREKLAAALGDRYELHREVGRGGMAVVFLAVDRKHGRNVAIKLLEPQLAAAVGGERFLREIAIAAKLQHPNIVPVYDSGQADGLLYYVMPFVEGESLRERLARERPLPLDLVRQIARDAGSALQYAHDHGIVHRDIKPENIMLSGGRAVVADFGIARALEAATPDSLTMTGMVVGTPHYMSPEQSSGSTIDGRTDQYSLACTLFEIIVGQPPFTGPTTRVVLAKHALDPVPRLRAVRDSVPPAIESAIMRAMAKSPEDRFESLSSFVDAIDSASSSTRAFTDGPARLYRRTARSRTARALLAGVALVSAAGLITRWAGGVESGAGVVSAVAVFPFAETGVSADSSYLGDGMTTGLIADLAGIGSLKVISRASGTLAGGSSRSLVEVGRQLGVQAVVRGTIRRSGDTVHVGVRFLAVSDSSLISDHDYSRPLGELPELQREITNDLTAAMNLPPGGATRLAPAPDVDPRALESYFRGRFHMDRGELDRALALFQQASSFAPDWAPPWVGQAEYYTSLPFFSDTAPARVLPQARSALSRAIELDETLPEAHAANAYIRAYYEWDWQAAEQEFRRAIALRPSYADAYFSYARFLASRRRLDEAIAQLGRAVDLDPLSLPLRANRALLDYFAGRYVEAESALRDVLRSDSTDLVAIWGLALVVEQLGRLDEATAILEPVSQVSLNRKSSLGHVYALAGKTDKARAILAALDEAAKLSYVPAYYFALVHTGLGRMEEALRDLERAYEERSTLLAYLLIDPRLAPLRTEPRFIALEQQLGVR